MSIEKKIPSGSEAIDQLLDGGYEPDTITVIYGPSGSGKTNLCLCALASIAQKKKAIFMDTEGGFSALRLAQIAGNSERIMKNVFFLQPTTFEEQRADFKKMKELVGEEIGIIIIDTISTLYRVERNEEDIREMNNSLGKQLNYLSQIARKKHIPVVVTSQVYSDFEDRGKIKMVGGYIVRYSGKCLIELQYENGVRTAILRKHRSLPESRQVFFEIRDKGVFLAKRKFSIF
jgi:DNA repair protein RadB